MSDWCDEHGTEKSICPACNRPEPVADLAGPRFQSTSRTQEMSPIPARYEGWCYRGRHEIDVGDLIVRSPDGGWVHVDC